MKIGFFTDTYTPQINGVVTSILLFKEQLENLGHEVYVFAPSPEHIDDSDETVRFPSIPFAFQKEMRFASPLSLDAFKMLDNVDLDIVHSHDPFSIGLFGLGVAIRRKIPYVHTYHTLYPEYVHYVWETRLTKKLAEWLSREFCDVCTSIIAPSSKVKGYLRSWGVTVPIDVIPTGIDVDRYAQADPARVAKLRAGLRIADDEQVLLFMGRLGREKNISLLLRAMWHVRTSSARLLIAGDGPYRADLESLVEDLDIADKVDFLGYLRRDDAVAAYHLADAFAFGSTTETQGLVIGEAMACGLPVVAVRDAAIEDFVSHGENGLLSEANPEAFAAAIDDLLGDRARMNDFGCAARQRAEQFSIANQTQRLLEHYERALAMPVRRRRLPKFPLPKRISLRRS